MTIEAGFSLAYRKTNADLINYPYYTKIRSSLSALLVYKSTSAFSQPNLPKVLPPQPAPPMTTSSSSSSSFLPLETKRLHFLALHPILGYQPIDLNIPVYYSAEEAAASFPRKPSTNEQPNVDAGAWRATMWILWMIIASSMIVGAMGVAASLCQ